MTRAPVGDLSHMGTLELNTTLDCSRDNNTVKHDITAAISDNAPRLPVARAAPADTDLENNARPLSAAHSVVGHPHSTRHLNSHAYYSSAPCDLGGAALARRSYARASSSAPPPHAPHDAKQCSINNIPSTP